MEISVECEVELIVKVYLCYMTAVHLHGCTAVLQLLRTRVSVNIYSLVFPIYLIFRVQMYIALSKFSLLVRLLTGIFSYAPTNLSALWLPVS